MAELSILQTRLAEAETALHQLLIGKRSVDLRVGEHSITYSQSNMAELKEYVAWLRNEILASSSSDSRVFTIQPNRGLS